MINKRIDDYLSNKHELHERKELLGKNNIDLSREVKILSQRLLKDITIEGKLNIIAGLIIVSCASCSGNKSLVSLALKLGAKIKE